MRERVAKRTIVHSNNDVNLAMPMLLLLRRDFLRIQIKAMVNKGFGFYTGETQFCHSGQSLCDT